MADTNFVDQQTTVVAAWLNDINVTVYRLLGNSSGAGGTGGAPATVADIISNLGLSSKYAPTSGSTYYAPSSGSAVYASSATLAASGGAALVGYSQGASGSVLRTQASKNQEFVSVLDFGADPTGTTDSTAAIQAAINYFGTGGTLSNSAGGLVYFPPGKYLISSQILVDNIGIRLLGASSQSVIILVTANLASAFKFTQNVANFSDVSVGMSEFVIDMQGFNGHGIWMLKPYDTSGCKNVYVKNVADAYNGVRIEPDPNNPGDPVSQSLVFNNVEVAHKNTTATAACWYLDSVQESQFIGCKGFAYFGSSVSAAIPWYLVNCRGILGLGCSSSQTSGFGIEIATTTRNSGGIQFIGHTFETCAQLLNATASGGYSAYEITLAYLRNEGSGGASTPIVLTGVTESEIECGPFAISLDANSHNNLIRCNAGVTVSNGGTGNVILERPSNSNPTYTITADSVLLSRSDGNSAVELDSTAVTLKASGATAAQAAYPFAASQAGMFLAINRGGTVALSQVVVGAAGSGGTGYRQLLVAN